MKRININAYQVGLVFKNGVYQRMLKEGAYWIWNEQVFAYDLTKAFNAPIELNILLKNNFHLISKQNSQYETGFLS